MPVESTNSRPDATSGPQANDPSQLPPADALKSAWSRFAEIGVFARAYVSAQGDLLKARIRNIAILAVLGIVALFALAALVAVLIVMLCLGLAQVIAAGLGDRIWAGNLIVSIGAFILLGAGGYLGSRIMRQKWLRQTQAKYERVHDDQRQQVGRSAFERAHEGAARDER